MAYATELTISTGNKVSVNYQSEEVNVSLTYQLERGDPDVLQVVGEKSQEVAAAHRLARERIRASQLEPEVPRLPEREEVSGAANVPAETSESAPPVPLTSGQLVALRALLDQADWNEDDIHAHLHDAFGCSDLEELSTSQAALWLVALQRMERLRTQKRSELQRQGTAHLNGH